MVIKVIHRWNITGAINETLGNTSPAAVETAIHQSSRRTSVESWIQFQCESSAVGHRRRNVRQTDANSIHLRTKYPPVEWWPRRFYLSDRNGTTFYPFFSFLFFFCFCFFSFGNVIPSGLVTSWRRHFENGSEFTQNYNGIKTPWLFPGLYFTGDVVYFYVWSSFWFGNVVLVVSSCQSLGHSSASSSSFYRLRLQSVNNRWTRCRNGGLLRCVCLG